MTQGATNATFAMEELKFGDTIKIAGREYHISGTAAEQQAIIAGSVKAGQQVTIDGIMYTCTSATVSNADKFELTLTDLQAKINTSSGGGVSVMIVNGKTYYGSGITNDKNVTTSAAAYKMIQKELGLASSIGADGSTPATVGAVTDGTDALAGKKVFTITKGKVEVREAMDFSLHVGADADMTNKIAVKIDSLDTKGLGIQGLNVKDPNGAAATYAIDAIADAVAKISAQRSLLGAVQNRLDHTINNLDNVVENTTAAESQIRDTDMATEMVKYSNNNVLAISHRQKTAVCAARQFSFCIWIEFFCFLQIKKTLLISQHLD